MWAGNERLGTILGALEHLLCDLSQFGKEIEEANLDGAF
jgi:hypothetical protein